MSSSDKINPPHYRRFGGVEVNDITQHLSFNLGNVVKYAARAGFKPGVDPLEDLKKARWYLNKEQVRLEKMIAEEEEKLKTKLEGHNNWAYLEDGERPALSNPHEDLEVKDWLR